MGRAVGVRVRRRSDIAFVGGQEEGNDIVVLPTICVTRAITYST